MSDPCTLFGEAPCTACDPRAQETPLSLVNRPGLSSLSYRVGTFWTFRAAMLDTIASERVISIDPSNLLRPPHVLTSGASDDYAIALLELWAYVCAALTIYQQAYANEAFLRTATLPESLARIAALLGYAPSRGVAATALLAFAADAGPPVTVPAGLQLQSIPPPGGTAETFETSAQITINSAANLLTLVGPPRPTTFSTGADLLAADAGAVGTGAKLVFRFETYGDLLAVDSVTTISPTRIGTHVSWHGDLGSVDATTIVASRYARTFHWFGYNVPATYLQGTPDSDPTKIDWTTETTNFAIQAQAPGAGHLFLDSVYDGIATGARFFVSSAYDDAPNALNGLLLADSSQIIPYFEQLYALWSADPSNPLWGWTDPLYWQAYWLEFQLDVAVTALNAQPPPDAVTRRDIYHAASDLLTSAIDTFRSSIAGIEASAQSKAFLNAHPPFSALIIDMDAVVGWFAETLVALPWGRVVTVAGVTQGPAQVGQASAAVTIVNIKEALPYIYDLRTISMYELLGPDVPFLTTQFPDAVKRSDPEAGATIYVTDDSAVQQGTTLALVQPTATGLQYDVVRLSTEPAQGGSAPFALAITPALSNDYIPSQTTVYANIGAATDGQTQKEQVLGDGDASAQWQEFALAVKPVTYVPDAASDSGASSTLKVLVDDIEWTEVRSFYGHGPQETVFVTREDETGTTFVKFGDGVTGRRLTTGSGNVHALLRKGVGAEGNVAPNTIATIMQQLPGLKSVINPIAAYGGADPESPDSIRANAPSSVVTLGRAVSLRDYEALALTYAGIAKAKAAWADFSSRRGVALTAAASGGKPLSQVAAPLRAFLDQHRDPNVPLAISEALKVLFSFGATVHVAAAYRQSIVAAAVNAALGPNGDGSGFLDFARVPIGCTLFQSELIGVLQDVTGVDWIELRYFTAFDPTHAFGGDPTRINALYVRATEIAWPSLTDDASAASVDLTFVGGILDPGSTS